MRVHQVESPVRDKASEPLHPTDTSRTVEGVPRHMRVLELLNQSVLPWQQVGDFIVESIVVEVWRG
jgi:hypothetical protein